MTDTVTTLQRRWAKLWKEIGIHDHDRALAQNWRELVALYSSKGRYYHTLAHIHAGLLEIDKVQRFVDDVDALELAYFYHDAIYDVHARNNEAESMRLLYRHTAEMPIPRTFVEYTGALIMVTRHMPDTLLTSNDERLISDIDLTTLGANPSAYEAYARDIRHEYSHLAAKEFAKGRAMVMQKFLDRPSIYYHPRFIKRYEFRARQNISRELARLGAVG